MLQIRADQFDAFRTNAVEQFIDRVVAHLRAAFPDIDGHFAAAELRAFVRYGVGVAETYGITDEVYVTRYVELMVELGEDFDEDPDLPWAADILGDEELAEAEAVALLIEYADDARPAGGAG